MVTKFKTKPPPTQSDDEVKQKPSLPLAQVNWANLCTLSPGMFREEVMMAAAAAGFIYPRAIYSFFRARRLSLFVSLMQIHLAHSFSLTHTPNSLGD